MAGFACNRVEKWSEDYCNALFRDVRVDLPLLFDIGVVLRKQPFDVVLLLLVLSNGFRL